MAVTGAAPNDLGPQWDAPPLNNYKRYALDEDQGPYWPDMLEQIILRFYKYVSERDGFIEKHPYLVQTPGASWGGATSYNWRAIVVLPKKGRKRLYWKTGERWTQS